MFYSGVARYGWGIRDFVSKIWLTLFFLSSSLHFILFLEYVESKKVM